MTQHSGAVSDFPASLEGVSAKTLPEAVEHMDSENKSAVLQELQNVCSDPEFHSSQRNCEFLRFVVSESLNGRGDDLRERTLGVELFGRSDTYDTAADAVVRVRANDVRKRLTRHYEKNPRRPAGRLPCRLAPTGPSSPAMSPGSRSLAIRSKVHPLHQPSPHHRISTRDTLPSGNCSPRLYLFLSYAPPCSDGRSWPTILL
jgi:hypothetical protein